MNQTATTQTASHRDAGCVLTAEPTATKVRLWINGATPHEGVVIDRPAGLPRWLAVSDATFEAWGPDLQQGLAAAVFTKHPGDEDAPYPPDVTQEAERLREQMTAADWLAYFGSLNATSEHWQPDWHRGLLTAMRTAQPEAVKASATEET